MNFTFRKARTHDVPRMHALLKDFAGQGLMLPRSLSNLYDFLQTFWVATPADEPDNLSGMAGLHVAWEGLGEVRSLVVKPEFRGSSVGDRLVGLLTDEALNLGLDELFVLTYIPEYFQRFGFKEVEKSRLPQKIWADCFKCVQFPNCEEIAMMKHIANKGG